jgi:hypothetical protein
MRKFIIILTLLLLSCSTNNIRNNKDRFVDFVNVNKTSIGMHEVTIKDKGFRLRIPNCLKSNESRISYYFFQNLKFSNNQRILTLYVPNKKYVLNKTTNAYSYKEFINQVEQLDILEEIKDVEFMKNKYFNIKLLDGNFFIMYVNIQEKNIDNFNYSINSVKIVDNVPN